MLQVTPQHTILLAVQPIDFRTGIDRLASLCKQNLTQDPFSGTVFVFTNQRKQSLKILVYDGKGFYFITRRFSSGKLAWWPTETATTYELGATELTILLAQGIPYKACIPEDWRKIKPPVNQVEHSPMRASSSVGVSEASP